MLSLEVFFLFWSHKVNDQAVKSKSQTTVFQLRAVQAFLNNLDSFFHF